MRDIVVKWRLFAKSPLALMLAGKFASSLASAFDLKVGFVGQAAAHDNNAILVSIDTSGECGGVRTWGCGGYF